MDKISVITISYNCKDVIEDTILSVIGQTYINIEYIIIDGASTDGTVNVIRRYADKINYFVSEPDKGIYDAMNKGLNAATGDWVIFMNAGDSFYNNTVIERFVPQIDIDTVIAHGDIMVIGKHFKYNRKPEPIGEMKDRMTVRHQATFTRLAYHKEHPFDTSFRSSGDYDFFYKAHFRDNVKFQYIPLCVANFDNTGTSNVNFKRSFRENRRIWGKENDKSFIIKQEITLYIWQLKRWIKNHFISEEKRVEHEKMKASNIGKVYELNGKVK